MGLEHLPAAATPKEVVAAVRADGACIVDDLVPPAALDGLAAELAPFVEQAPSGPDDFTGRNTRRAGALVARCPAVRPLVQHPLVLGSTKELLDGATSFHLHLTQVIAIGPDSPAQGIHRDQWAFDFFPFPIGYDVQLNTIWALTDFTEENGATRVVPGSHLAPDGSIFTEADTVGAVMGRGSVLVYSGSVYHGGGANSSAETRTGINLTYARSWLRQEENQYLAVPQDVARELDDDLLRLLGYARGAYALGYVGDMHDPLDVLRGRGGTSVGFR